MILAHRLHHHHHHLPGEKFQILYVFIFGIYSDFMQIILKIFRSILVCICVCNLWMSCCDDI